VIGLITATDDELLAAMDAASFECFYRRHFEAVLAFFARRTRDPELAADLTAETFGPRAGRPPPLPAGPRAGGLVAVLDRVPQAQRHAPPRARGGRALRRLGMQPPELDDDDVAWIEQLALDDRALPVLADLPPEQAAAIRAHVVDERGYEEIARATETSQAAVRKRVSRGLAAVRRRMGVSE
jgi:DNA-directed RNA polymerase specialized sigma24 family protein